MPPAEWIKDGDGPKLAWIGAFVPRHGGKKKPIDLWALQKQRDGLGFEVQFYFQRRIILLLRYYCRLKTWH